MTNQIKAMLLAFVLIGSVVTVAMSLSPKHRHLTISAPVAVVQVPVADTREQRIQLEMWEVAKVFGRDSGCKDADPTLGRLVAEASIDEAVDPRIVAAVISIESKCSQFAVSSRGAIGLMQVMAKTWSAKYDFGGRVNLLNPKDNISIGAKILSSAMKQYGPQKGIQAYNGLGVGCSTCDGDYSDKVLKLAGI